MRWLNTRAATLATLGAALLASGCVMEDQRPEADQLGVTQDQIVGPDLKWSGRAGVVRILVGKRAYTGVLVAPNLAITSKNFVDASMTQNVTLEYAPPSSTARRKARYINSSWYLPHATIQFDGFGGAQVPVVEIRSGASLQNMLLRCYAYDSPTLGEYASFVVTSASSTRVTAAGLNGEIMERNNLGAPCFELGGTAKLVGILTAVNAGTITLRRVSSLQEFVDDMIHLAEVRDRAERQDDVFGPYRIYNMPPDDSTMCLDVPWGSPLSHAVINQYPCHDGSNQKWYLEGVGGSYSRIVSANSGKCIDVPNASTADNVALQQYPCHGGNNQQWNIRDAPRTDGYRLQPRHTEALGRCMSVRNGPSTSSQRAIQGTCPYTTSIAGHEHRRWGFMP